MVFSYFDVNTNPSRSSSLSFQFLFTGVFLFKWIRSFQQPQDQVSVLLNGVRFTHSKLSLFFPPSLPLFFSKDSDLLIEYPSYWCEASPFFFYQYSYPVILMKILTQLLVHHSSFFYLLRWFQIKLCGSYTFSSFQIPFLTGAPLYHSPLAIHLFRSAEDISKICVFTLHPFKLFRGPILFKPFNSTGAFSFSSNRFNGVSFEWALTHRSFPRILPDSSYFPGAILKFLFEVWRKNEVFHQSDVFIQDLSISYHCWINLSILHSGVSK